MALRNEKGYAYYLKTAILTLCTAVALTMNFSPRDTSGMGLSALYPDLLNGFEGTSFIAAVVWAALFYGAVKIDDLKRFKMRKIHSIVPVCLLLAAVWMMGKSFSIDNTHNALCSSYVQILKTIVYMTGITYLLSQAAYLFKSLLDAGAAGHVTAVSGTSGLKGLYQKHPFGAPLVVLLVGMLPHLLLSYPVRMSYDARNQLGYYFGLLPFSSHHPPFGSWLMGKVVSVGLLAGSGNLGVFLYCILQYLAFAFVTAYLLYTLQVYLYAPKWLPMITLLVTLLSPYHAAFVGVMLKDLLYSYCLLLFMIEMAYILRAGIPCRKHIIILCIAGILTTLLRNNGKYVVYPTIVLLAFFSLRRKGRKEKIALWTAAVSVIVCSLLVEGYFQRRYVQVQGSIAEALSLPFQQTARYVKEYGDEVTPEEREVIDRVLDYDNLASIYDPELSDFVKWTYRGTEEDLKAYFQVWLQQFLKHPWCYAEATLNQNYLLFYAPAEIYTYFVDAVDDTGQGQKLAAYLNIHEVESGVLQGLRTLQELYVGSMIMVPGIGMFSNVGFYNLLFIFVFLFAIREKCSRTLLLSVPFFLSDLIVVAAPYVGPRYVFPVIYGMPCLLAFYMDERRRKTAWEEESAG